MGKIEETKTKVKDFWKNHKYEIYGVALYGSCYLVGWKIGKFAFNKAYGKGVSDTIAACEKLLPEAQVASTLYQASLKAAKK